MVLNIVLNLFDFHHLHHSSPLFKKWQDVPDDPKIAIFKAKQSPWLLAEARE